MSILFTYFNKIKTKWGIKSNLDLVVILFIFSIAGSSVLYVADILLPLLGITEKSSGMIKLTVRILLIFPIYQILILIYSLLLGQFSFFWEKQKQLGRLILKLFSVK